VLRRRTRLGWEGWYFLLVMGFLLIGAVLREINLLMVLFGLMAGALFFSWRTVVKSLAWLEVRRLAPESVSQGNDLVVTVEARNAHPKVSRWAVTVEDALMGEAGPAAGVRMGAKVYFTHVRPGETARLDYRGSAPRRGVYRYGSLRLFTRFPIGLWRRTVDLDQPGTLTVTPRLGRLTPRWAARQREVTAGQRQRQRPLGLREGDYHGLRDWRPGDSPRWIHWRTSARRGELMVRQFEQDRNRDLVLVVELWQPAEESAEAREAVELAVRFAATLVAEQCRRGTNQFVLALAGQETAVVRGPASTGLERQALRKLAVAEGTSQDLLGGVLDQALRDVRPETDVVLLSTRTIDTSDTQRFGALWRDAQRQSLLGQCLTVDVCSESLGMWYEE
jgi:uncharacterized protein (DUF58 family)